MSLRWSLRLHDSSLVESIERNASVSPVVAQLLALRGITSPDAIKSFFNLKMTGLRAPAELPGLNEAVKAIYAAVTAGKKIYIYGDYDADGMTSTAIMYRSLKLLKANVHYFVPSRLDDGYGLSIETLERLRDRGAEFIITVDCGISSVKETEFCTENNIEIVITDHHHVGDVLPAAAAIVHPALPGFDYPFDGLCGAGVAFKLAWGLCIEHHGSPKLSEPLRNFLFGAVSLAAIGTVCDVVPMQDENRILVHHGMNCLREFANPGLRHLLALSNLIDKPKIESEDLGFGIGPRLNAAGRLGQAQLGVELLITQDNDRAKELAEYIDALNKNRKSLEIKIQKSAEKQIEESFNADRDAALVLAANDWHLGVIGIVAGRLAEKYQRPTILISTDANGERDGVGSCRSACGIDLYAALDQCENQLEKFGGHTAAAGLAIKKENIDAFREDFCEAVVRQVSFEDLYQDLDIDAEALVGHLTMGMMKQLNQMAPFGQSNPRPVLCINNVQLQDVRTMGNEDQHLSILITQHDNRIRAVGFGKGEWSKPLSEPDQTFDFACRPVINSFRGQQSVELHLIDYRPNKAEALADR
jgi:single-stranded-DNA-specific exonuclease